MDAHEADPVFPAEVQENPEFPDATQRVAELAHHNHIFLAQTGEHPPPLGAVLLLGSFFFNDGVTAELLHPGSVFVSGGQILREEKVSVLCHISGCYLPLMYEELLTRQMILDFILDIIPA